MTQPTIAFIGGGNMAFSIIGGLIESGWPSANITASDPMQAQRQNYDHFRIRCHDNNVDAVNTADIVVLATKPQVLKEAILSIRAPLMDRQPLLVSIAAGILSEDILRWAGHPLPLIRVMPNTPALVNCGVSGLYATSICNNDHLEQAEQIMQAVGKTIRVKEEKDIDTVTGISGSGPAYFFKLMEIMMETAIANGISEADARTLVLQTASGAALLAGSSEETPKTLRRQVTSPAGTTEAAINFMEASHIDDAISGGIHAAIKRSEELARELGGE